MFIGDFRCYRKNKRTVRQFLVHVPILFVKEWVSKVRTKPVDSAEERGGGVDHGNLARTVESGMCAMSL